MEFCFAKRKMPEIAFANWKLVLQLTKWYKDSNGFGENDKTSTLYHFKNDKVHRKNLLKNVKDGAIL